MKSKYRNKTLHEKYHTKVRKPIAPPTEFHKDKSKYDRKQNVVEIRDDLKASGCSEDLLRNVVE